MKKWHALQEQDAENQHRPQPLRGRLRGSRSTRLTPFTSRSRTDRLDSVSLATQVSQVKRLISKNCPVQSSVLPPNPLPNPTPHPPPSLCSRSADASPRSDAIRAEGMGRWGRRVAGGGGKLKTNFGPISTQWRGGCC